MFYVYVLRCCDNSLYCGITTDVQRRFKEHQSGGSLGAKYTRSHKPSHIEAVWSASDRAKASVLEAFFKKLPRAAKESIVLNPKLLKEKYSDKLKNYEYSYEPDKIINSALSVPENM